MFKHAHARARTSERKLAVRNILPPPPPHFSLSRTRVASSFVAAAQGGQLPQRSLVQCARSQNSSFVTPLPTSAKVAVFQFTIIVLYLLLKSTEETDHISM